MQANVESYLTSNHLDHGHAEAGVMCKDCHSDYGIRDEIQSVLNFVTGNYMSNADGSFPKRDFEDGICTQCHGDMIGVVLSTDVLCYNPHNRRMGTFICDSRHVSHGPRSDNCNGCHTNGGRCMIEDKYPTHRADGRA